MLLRRVVHQNVQPPKLFNSPLHDDIAMARLANVPRNSFAASSFVLDHARRLFRVLVFIEVRDEDIRTFFGKRNSHGTANTGITATDDSCLPLQFAAGKIFRRLRFWLRLHLILTTGTCPLFLFGAEMPSFSMFLHPSSFFRR